MYAYVQTGCNWNQHISFFSCSYFLIYLERWHYNLMTKTREFCFMFHNMRRRKRSWPQVSFPYFKLSCQQNLTAANKIVDSHKLLHKDWLIWQNWWSQILIMWTVQYAFKELAFYLLLGFVDVSFCRYLWEKWRGPMYVVQLCDSQ